MKNKVQEALDYFDNQQCRSCQKLTYAEYSAITKEKKAVVKQLTDCQVSKEFIDMTIDIWESEMMNCDGYTNSEEQCVEQGLELLRKQKEMWEEE